MMNDGIELVLHGVKDLNCDCSRNTEATEEKISRSKELEANSYNLITLVGFLKYAKIIETI